MHFSIDKSDLELFETKLFDLPGELRDKSILVSGASGFFGRCLLECLLHLDWRHGLNIKIYAVSRNLESFKKKFPILSSSKINLIESNISQLKDFHDKVDYIIHAACDTSSERLKNSPHKFLEENYLGTQNMLEIARSNKGCRFLYLSSGAIYGAQNLDMKLRLESDLSAPDLQKISSVYGEAKRLGEILCSIYSSSYAVQTSVARCFSFVGPYMNFDGHYAIGNFIRDVANNKDVILQSKSKTYRSYLYSIDLAIWLMRILISAPNNSVYNVGSSQEILIEDLAGLVVKTLSSKSKIAFSDNQGFNTSSSSRYISCNEKAKLELGLEQYTSLEKAIKSTFLWYQKNNSL
ncbi:MAG: NAD(P)-dependent oxidoreductase [Proteobacteria bacterium]|nr:NAD(P)-dependent oxidoreductase [Pseudomonadota bacterium]